MPVQDIVRQFAVGGGVRLPMSAMLALTTGSGIGTGNAPYLIVSALDRNEYSEGATGVTGYFTGGGVALSLTQAQAQAQAQAQGSGNERVAGIVYQWTGGQYVNAMYGALSNLAYVSSGSAGDVTNISFFGVTGLPAALQHANDPVWLIQHDAAGYDGSVTVVTTGAAVAVAVAGAPTPDGVAACAATFVGQAWNDEGCWNLASTIAAEAGAGLPVSATALGVPGHGNGAWVVVYNGPAHASAAWKTLVNAGDVIVFGTPGGGGHIATCVAGSGASAMLVDNITYVNAQGQISDPAHDGSAQDVLVQAPHAAVQEWAGVQADSVVIYALDTPVISAAGAVDMLAANAVVSLASLVAIADPAGRAVTQIQVYEQGAACTLLLNGAAALGASAAHPLSASSLAAISVQAGARAGSEALTLRAWNGAYWGDWQNVQIDVAGAGNAAGVGGIAVAAGDWTGAQGLPAPSGYAQSGYFQSGYFQSGHGAALGGITVPDVHGGRIGAGSWLTSGDVTHTHVMPDARS